MNTEKIFAIIVTYNPDISLLNRQLRSLKEQVYSIVLVDNNSNNSADLKVLLKTNYNTVFFISNLENQGLGKAQNIGIFKANEMGATDVLLLDQDSVLNPDCVAELVIARNLLASLNISVGAVGPSYYNEKTGNIYPISKYFGPFIKRIIPRDKSEKASFLIASGCLIRLETLEKVGFMNEELFIDYIDIEWSFRAQSFGYNLYAVPKALMVHAIGENSFAVAGREISNHGVLRRYYLCRNSILMIKNKNVPVGYKLREIVLNFLRIFMFLIFSTERRRYLRYSLQGYLDGISNRGGICKYVFN